MLAGRVVIMLEKQCNPDANFDSRASRACYRRRVRSNGPEIVRVGARLHPLRDLYARLMRARWGTLILLVVTLFLAINAIFAGVLVGVGDCIEGARPGSFWDAFHFSVQTLSTIGYGALSPKGACGDAVVSAEALTGMLGFAVVTGLVFVKFARPRAGILFSDVAVITERDGLPCLMFRLANERGSDIVEASLHATVLLDEETVEGEHMRRLHDLKLLRDATPLLLLSWLVIHPIDEDSPLYGLDAEACAEEELRLIVSVTGMDGTFMQQVYAYHHYRVEDLRFGHRFADVVTPLADGRTELNLRRFHDTEPVEGA